MVGALLALSCIVVSYYAYGMLHRYQRQNYVRRQYVAFDDAMAAQHFAHILATDFSRAVYDHCKHLYERNNLAQATYTSEQRIPNIIHQIWLGSPFPEEFRKYQQSWIEHHPQWRYILWTDDDVKQLKLVNQDLYDASLNYGEKSDILRYELLYRYGGLYVDVDFECLKPFDDLLHCYDFFIGLQPLDTGFAQLGIGLIGTRPQYPLLKKMIEKIRENTTSQIIARTGPVHATVVFCQNVAPHAHGIIAFPATYFYPCAYQQKGTPPTVWRRSESYAVHHWAGSWLRPAGFVAQR